MNIGIFTDTYTPQINGVVISIDNLTEGMKKRGHNVYVFTAKDPKLKELPQDKIHEDYAYRLPSIPVPFSPEHRLAVGYYRKMYKKVKELNLDVIHTQSEFSLGILGTILGKKLGIPVIHTYHTMWSDYAHYITRIKNEKVNMPVATLIQKISKVFCEKTNAVIAPSQKTKDALIKYGVKKPIMIIPTGMDLKPYKEKVDDKELNELRKELGLKPHDKVILFIGRVAEEKSIDVIIKQFVNVKEKIKDAKLLIVGDGPAKGDLEHLVKKLNLDSDVIFTGKVEHNEIAKYYKLGDVFVNASTTETQGLTFIEAMAAGVPVVAKFDKNLNGVIQDGISGSLFVNESDFADMVVNSINDRKFRENIILNARSVADTYSIDSFVDKIEIAYQALISNHQYKTKRERKIKVFKA